MSAHDGDDTVSGIRKKECVEIFGNRVVVKGLRQRVLDGHLSDGLDIVVIDALVITVAT